MINITNKYQCSGCTACANSCALGAIRMEPDAMGFQYPIVDMEKCVDCGICEKVCQFSPLYDTSNNLAVPTYIAARLKNNNDLLNSTSGGAFIGIAQCILSIGGVIYGVSYDDQFRVVHKRATTWEECQQFKGSKYVQSDLTDIFKNIKNDLKNHNIVLFTGTPCQVAGLKSYIGPNLSDKLYTVDLICHGVPAPFVWRDYLNYLEHKQKDKIIAVRFRNKEEYGWKSSRTTFKFSKHPNRWISFLSTFHREVLFRPSCSSCPFTNIKRVGDLTIGDFWSKKEIEPITTDDKGCSLMIINTTKGQDVFNDCARYLIYEKVTADDAFQVHLKYPVERDTNADLFAQEYSTNGFMPAMRKYHDLGIKKQIRMHIGLLKKNVRNLISKYK